MLAKQTYNIPVTDLKLLDDFPVDLNNDFAMDTVEEEFGYLEWFFSPPHTSGKA